jgi:hypothetical protein
MHKSVWEFSCFLACQWKYYCWYAIEKKVLYSLSITSYEIELAQYNWFSISVYNSLYFKMLANLRGQTIRITIAWSTFYTNERLVHWVDCWHIMKMLAKYSSIHIYSSQVKLKSNQMTFVRGHTILASSKQQNYEIGK